ncbi:MAG TPA: hypothetical protein VN649_15175 [Ramlibacter sp.]|nr:hypothetical protein [Ramlibacter sp.]
MTKLIALVAVLALSGCVGYYGAPYGSYYGNPYYDGAPYYGGASIGFFGSSGGGHPRHFNRDRDGDGVPNRRDAFPNDPTRR